MENVLLAATNLLAVPAIWLNVEAGQLFRAQCLAFAMLASMVYHLVEHRKHGLPGIGMWMTGKWRVWLQGPVAHHVLINIDRLGVLLAVEGFRQTMGWELMRDELLFRWPTVLFAISVLLISESFHYFRRSLWSFVSDGTLKIGFVLGHSAWHVCAFWIALQLSACDLNPIVPS